MRPAAQRVQRDQNDGGARAPCGSARPRCRRVQGGSRRTAPSRDGCVRACACACVGARSARARARARVRITAGAAAGGAGGAGPGREEERRARAERGCRRAEGRRVAWNLTLANHRYP